MVSIQNKVGLNTSFKHHMTCNCKSSTAHIEGSRMHRLWVGRTFHPEKNLNLDHGDKWLIS